MKILVRLPNWLGDMVMSVGFINQLGLFFPGTEVTVIAKKGINDLLHFFPSIKNRFIFSKEEFRGLQGVWQFGRRIKETEKFDLFFSLPDSFSSALMGLASGSKKRIGYRKEGRGILLTDSFVKQKGLHRVEEYVQLLELYSGRKAAPLSVTLKHGFQKGGHIAININSEASSRRLTAGKAVEIIQSVRANFKNKIILVGGPGEAAFVENVFQLLPDKEGIESMAGKTTLLQLAELLASAQIMLTTDSGPAHLANALGTQTIVLFGAGNENNTAPYNREAVQTLRLGKLSCEPCTKNVCVQFGTPQCLELLEVSTISALLKQKMPVSCR